jgi:hypothetical protein
MSIKGDTMNTIPRSPLAESAQNTNSNLVKRHPIASVLILMFALAWAGLIPEALASQGLIPFQVPRVIEFLVGWTPALAAIIVTGIIEGRKGIGALLRRFLIARVNVVWYLIALFGIAAPFYWTVALIVFATIIVVLIFGPARLARHTPTPATGFLDKPRDA